MQRCCQCRGDVRVRFTANYAASCAYGFGKRYRPFSEIGPNVDYIGTLWSKAKDRFWNVKPIEHQMLPSRVQRRWDKCEFIMVRKDIGARPIAL